jgi:hypothetical protein
MPAADERQPAAIRLGHPALPLLGAFALVALAIHPLFLGGLVPHAYDLDSFYAPSWQFLAHSLRAGTLPRWNPYALGGAPFTGDPQSQALYPPTLALFGLLSLPAATVIWFAFHYLVAAAGTFRLARNLTLSPRAAAIAAVLFAASTYLVARVQSPTLLAGAAWMPVVLAAAIGCSFRDDRRRHLVNAPLALAFALQVLSGSQQVLLLTSVACVLAALVLRSRREVVRTVLGLGLAALVAAPQLLPMAALVKSSTASSGIDTSGFGALSWGDRSILAGSFSHTASETAPVYLGVFGLGQAVVALVGGRARRPIQLICALLALSLVWSVGLVGDVVSVVFPPFATITAHQPVRALPLAVLALALGVGAYWDRVQRIREIALVAAVTLLALVVAGTLGPVETWVMVAGAAGSLAAMLAARARPKAIWPILAFALVLAGDLAIHNVNLRNTHQPPAVWQHASSLYPPAPATARAVRDAGVGLGEQRFAWLAPPAIREHQLSRAQTAAGRALLLNGGALRDALPALSGYNPLIVRSFARLVDRSNGTPIADRHFVYLTRAPTPLTRAYAVGVYLCSAVDCPPGLPVVARADGLEVVRDAKAQPFAAISPTGGRSTALTARWPSPQSIEVTHAAATGGGVVSIASRAASGWRASIDGHGVPIAKGRFGQITLPAPAGWTRIRLSYTPPGMRLGILLAILGLAICAIPSGFRLRRTE